jgi:hypothetical protein
MITESPAEVLIADRIWIATALLHRKYPLRSDFKKAEIRQMLEVEGLADGVKGGTINAHLDQNCVANVPPSSGKYRMLFEPTPGNLRLFRPGDLTHPGRVLRRKQSKSLPNREEIPPQYRPLLDWYEDWIKETRPPDAELTWEDDPLIRLIGSGKHIWADEHADEYVENLRRDDPA